MGEKHNLSLCRSLRNASVLFEKKVPFSELKRTNMLDILGNQTFRHQTVSAPRRFGTKTFRA